MYLKNAYDKPIYCKRNKSKLYFFIMRDKRNYGPHTALKLL